MKRQFFAAVMIASLLAPVASLAQEAKKKTRKARPAAQKESLHDQVSGQGYGLAGCGLGSIVFGPKMGKIQIVAATLNGTGGQTFGITFGTSNCDIPEMGHQVAAFIEVNREILAKEAARGEGETVTGLASILNCDDSAVLGESLQKNFESIFAADKSSYDTTRAILSTINNNPSLSASCHTSPING